MLKVVFFQFFERVPYGLMRYDIVLADGDQGARGDSGVVGPLTCMCMSPSFYG
jgi:hypothetical protein